VAQAAMEPRKSLIAAALQGDGFRLRLAAALFTLGAAIIHFAVVPEHLLRYLPYGVFFLVIGFTQLGLVAVLLVRPSPLVLLGGAAGTLAVIGIWIASRTVGIPIGPDSQAAEPVGLPDLFTTLMEYIAAVLLLLADMRLAKPQRSVPRQRTIVGLLIAGLASLTLTSIGLAGVVAGGH
jgi:hypothetical protein